MTADQLRECREAFEKWSEIGDLHGPKKAVAWSAWQAAWNTRPTAVASHAEGRWWLGSTEKQANHGVL